MKDWKNALIQNYKSLDLNEIELAMILLVSSYLENGETFITPDLLALKMSIPFKDVDKYFTGLIKKGHFKYDKDFRLLLDNLVTYLEVRYLDTSVDSNPSLVKYFEGYFGRALSEAEISTINEWKNKGYEEEKIKEASTLANNAGAKSIRYIDKILLEWQRKDEIYKQGKTMPDKWSKNLVETLEIAKINWIDDDDK